MERLRPVLTWVFLLLGVVFIVVGFCRGQQLDVMQKAANLCLECIGVG